jgi:hypothetical protein
VEINLEEKVKIKIILKEELQEIKIKMSKKLMI